jgi:hypothetical protein
LEEIDEEELKRNERKEIKGKTLFLNESFASEYNSE